MKRYKPVKKDMIMVKWRDAATLAQWVDGDSHEEARTMECVTVGLFVQRKNGDLKVALNMTEDGQFGDIIAIPYSQVTELYKLVGEEKDDEKPKKKKDI